MKKERNSKDIFSCIECCSLKSSETFITTRCERCGLKKENLEVDFGAEWRSFSQKNHCQSTNERGTASKNMFLTEKSIITSLPKADALLGHFKRTVDAHLSPKCHFEDINTLCDTLNLNASCVRNRACDISADMITLGLQKSTRLITLHAASILYATRLQGGDFNRTFREVAMAASRPQKEIARCFKSIENALMINQNSSNKVVEHPIVSFAKNFSIYLKMKREWVVFTEALAKNVVPGAIDCNNNPSSFKKAWEGRSRASIAATVVYIVSRLPNYPDQIDLNTIAFRTSVRVSTIMTCYRDMLPVIDKIFDGVLENVTSKTEVLGTFKTDLLSLRSTEHLID